MRADEVYAILKGKIVKLTEDIKEVGDWKPIRHQGTVQTAEDLPADAKEGYMYNIATDSIYGAAGMNVVKTADGWDPMGPIVNMDLYLSKEEAKKGYQPAGDYLTENKAKKTYQPVGNYSTKEETEKKLNKNQGINNAGKITGINADGDIVPVFPTGVQYNEETNLLEFGTDPNMLNKGIQLDATLKKSGYAADSAAVGENIDSLKEDISTKISKFYASNQGETHLSDSDNGKIMDMMLYGKSEQKQYSGKNLLNATLQTTTRNGVTCTNNGDGTYTLNGTTTTTTVFDIAQDVSCSSFRLAGCPVGGAHDASYELQARTDNLIYGYDTGDGKNIKADENFFIRIRINTGINCNNLLFKPMIVDDSLYPDATYDDFEPYTGGTPSPNPDYPQEIKSVVNPTVKVCGKNLFNSKKFPIILNRAIDTNTGVVYESSGGKYCATEKYIPFPYGGKIISFNASMSLCAYDKDYKFISAIRYHSQAPFGTTYVRFDIKIEDKDKAQIELSESTTTYEPYHEQTVTLPYTLNAIPVSSGGNITIDGQQYIADYVDVERGKLVRMVGEFVQNNQEWRIEKIALSYSVFSAKTPINNMQQNDDILNYCSNYFKCIATNKRYSENTLFINSGYILIATMPSGTIIDDFLALVKGKLKVFYALATPIETDLITEEVTAFKALATYYPTTNISINSEQLDGYTVFDYPISMENGWNYVKQQIGDTRDYIYDMDARTQDTDLQAAEAYVNSEYAVVLTELEV